MVLDSNLPSGHLWQKLTALSINSEGFPDVLAAVLTSREEMKVISRLHGDEVLSFLNIVDQAMEAPLVGVKLRKKCLMVLRRICGLCGSLPSSHMIVDGLRKTDDHALTSGGFADVWRGTFDDKKVAIKAFRIYAAGDLVQVKKRFCKEAVIWRRLSHPNILSFLGASTSLFQLCMVCEWMDHGTIFQYLKANPKSNRLVLLNGVVRGLEYLHSIGCIHGDLKGANILINDNLQACIADFGLMSIASDPSTSNASTTMTSATGSTRWMSPELMNPEEFGLNRSNPTKESDIYALGMVIYEIFAGIPPFQGCRDATVIHKVLSGVRPDRPEGADVLGLSEDVWKIMETCWQTEWGKRPVVSVVLKTVEMAASSWDPPEPIPQEEGLGEHENDSDSSLCESFSSELCISWGSGQRSPWSLEPESVTSAGHAPSSCLVASGSTASNHSLTGNTSPLMWQTHIPTTPGYSSSGSPEESEQGYSSSDEATADSTRAVHGDVGIHSQFIGPSNVGTTMEELGMGSALSRADPMEAVKVWVMAQEEITRIHGRRYRPGIAFLEQPSYIKAPENVLPEEQSPEVDCLP